MTARALLLAARRLALAFFLSIAAAGAAQAQSDKAGSKDFAPLGRLPDCYIVDYDVSEADQQIFYTSAEDQETVEGRKTLIEYAFRRGAKPAPKTEIFKYHIDAVKQHGGALVFEDLDDNMATFKLPRDGKTLWIAVSIFEDGHNYTVTVVEP